MGADFVAGTEKPTTARATVQFKVVVVGQQRMEEEAMGWTKRQKKATIHNNNKAYLKL